MKYFMVAAAGVGLLVVSAMADEKVAPKAGSDLKDVRSKASYGIGQQLGKNFKNQSIDLDPDMLARGIKDALAGKSELTDADIQEALQALQKDLMAKQQAQGEENAKSQTAFLQENAKKPGVTTLKSGLQYKVVKEGTGPTPKATDKVRVHYKGTLTNGKQFDSSYDRGEPAEFPVNRVIPGWTEALQLMKVGSKWQLFIPANLAYGASPPPGIPPNSTLLFDVELLKIQ